MKKKMPETIETCGKCPFAKKLNDHQVGCILNRRNGMGGGAPTVTNEFGSIPAWCPLEDVEK